MFSTGQWVFAGIFALVFSAVVALAYYKDKKLHARNYKGVIWVAILFAGFIILLLLMKYLLKN